MYFKPRIFISSTLNLINVRGKIESHLGSVGAETILFEKNLTPSIDPATYRSDVLESDFVIFIFDKDYGTVTESGKSGTHEEWDLIFSSIIPKHVYIKKATKRDENLEKLLRDINSKNISYYLYKDDSDLLKQIKRTTFTIARDIALKKINLEHIKENKFRRLAIEFDYNKSMEFIRAIEDIRQGHNNVTSPIDFVNTTALSSVMEYWIDFFKNCEENPFIDTKQNQNFSDLIKTYMEYYKYLFKNFQASGNSYTIHLEKADYPIFFSSVRCIGDSYSTKHMDELIRNFLAKTNNFKDYISSRKIFADTNFLD